MFSVETNRVYVPGSEQVGHTLDCYLPREADGSPLNSPCPLVVYIHGGGWTERDKNDYKHIGMAFSSRGIACAIINYRLSPLSVPEGSEDHFKHPEHTKDCAMALAYLGQQSVEYGFLKNEVILIGHSAGGFMAGVLQFDQPIRTMWENHLNVRYFVGLEGIYHLPSLLKDFGTPYLYGMIAPAFGWNTEVHENASPTALVNKLPPTGTGLLTSTPWILIWSDQDSMINLRQSQDFQSALQSKGISVEHVVIKSEDAEDASHHGITSASGFNKYILSIILSLCKNDK